MNNKNAVITGGSDGVGRACVFELAKAGFNIITIGRSKEKIEKLQEEYNNKFKTKLYSLSGDLLNDSDFENFLSQINKNFENIDLVINNAGFQIANSLLEDSDIEAIESMFKIHTTVPLKLYKALFPKMKVAGSGMIINIVSIVVKNYLKETYGPYTLTKYAEYGLSNMMIKEASKHNIRVTNVILGGVNSNIRSEERPGYLSPENVAKVIGGVVSAPQEVFISEIALHPKVQLS